nr:sensor histidine kinase [Clostridium chrysemydis]
MSFLDYIKDKLFFIIMNIFIFGIMSVLMGIFKFGSGIVFIVFVIWFLPLISYIIAEFIRERKFFNELKIVTEELDKKYLIAEVIEEPNFIEGKILYDSLRESNKVMHETLNDYKKIQKDYKEYIEMWVHEIKTPIASSKLYIENNKETVGKELVNDINSIDSMVEQVLYYSKMDTANDDYIIKKIKLKDVVNKVIKRNSRVFIRKRIMVETVGLEETVYSDSKWLEFIINQIINNSLKYTDSFGKITISSLENKDNVVLFIRDNGVGIREEDIDKIFNKGFTGENGRIFGKSTGVGLYICKKLCKKLRIGISPKRLEKGTELKLVFPVGSNTNFKE